MRIVDKKTFLSMPVNTVFSKYEPCFFSDIMIKGDTYKNDFWFQQIADSLECEENGEFFGSETIGKLEDGSTVKLDFYCESRDGLPDEKQLFAIWDKEDVFNLMKRLSEIIPDRLEELCQ